MQTSSRPLALVLILTASLVTALAGSALASTAGKGAASASSKPKSLQGRSGSHVSPRIALASGRAVDSRRHPARVQQRSGASAGAASKVVSSKEGAVATPSAAESPGILFNGDFDSGWKGWYVQSLSYRASLVSSGAFEGSGAARFEVQAGDVEPDTGSQRSEVSGPTFKEGEDLYVRDAIRVPAGNTYSAPWQIIQQWHEEDWGGSPGMAVFLENDRSLRLGAGDGSPTFWKGPALQSGRWYDLVYRMKLSQSTSTGFVEVWLDGVQQKLANGQTRIYGQTTQMPETYLKAGIYRSKSSTGTSIVEHDALVVGTSYAAVAQG